MHCIRDCRFSRNIWQKLGFTTHDFFSSNCAYDWLKTGTKNGRSVIFIAALWWIWRHRNQMCFNNDIWSITRLCTNIQNSEDVINKSFLSDGATTHSNRLVRWNSSNHHCHILNVDGNCLGSPIRAGYGGLI